MSTWQRKEGKRESGGLNQKGVDSYKRENPGSNLQTAVTTSPSKLKKDKHVKFAVGRNEENERITGIPSSSAFVAESLSIDIDYRSQSNSEIVSNANLILRSAMVCPTEVWHIA